ncbi:MAG: M15 family metallopeptidase [Clostridia bacterium]|nr:M15 family metallopeptidase [Clostridia bacterium]
MNRKIIPAALAVIAAAALIFCVRAVVTKGRQTINTAEISENPQTDDTSVVTVTDVSQSLTEESSLTESATDSAVPVTMPGPASVTVSTRLDTTSSLPSTSKAPASPVTSTTAAKPSSTAAPKTTSTTAASTKATSDYPYAYAGFNPRPADLNVADWRLILVNRDYILPDGYEPPELVHSVKGDSDSKLLDSRVAPYYNEMYLAAQKDGIDLYTVSGCRSYARQKTNFENKISTYRSNGMSKVEATQKAATIILPPGTSEHNLGFAMDIGSLEQSFENSKAFEWLSKHAADYGFILRYPKNKQDITKIIYEPWHWRYVGVEHAKAIKAAGVCLEEYLGKA